MLSSAPESLDVLEPQRGNGLQWASVAVVLLVALSVRLFQIEQQAVCDDEFYCMRFFPAASLDGFINDIRQDSPDMPPLYFILAYGWSCVFGPSPVAMRCLAVILSLCCACLLYVIGRRISGHMAGLLSAFAFSLSPLHVFYGQDIRVYALYSALGLLSMMAFLEIIRAPSRLWWVLNWLSNTLLLYTHFVSGLFIIVQFAFLLALRPRSAKTLLLWSFSHAASALPLVPWVIALYSGHSTPTSSLPPLAMVLLIFAFSEFSRCGFAECLPSWRGCLPQDAVSTWHVVVIASGVSLLAIHLASVARVLRLLFVHCPLGKNFGIGESTRAARNKSMCVSPEHCGRRGLELAFLFSWFFGPAVLLYLLAAVRLPANVLQLRYVIASQLAIYILVGVAAAAGGTYLGRRTFSAAVVVLYIAGTFVAYAYPPRGDYFGVIRVLRKAMPPDRAVVLVSNHGDGLFRYNLGSTPLSVVSACTSEDLRKDLQEQLRNYGDAWLVFEARGNPEQEETLMAAFYSAADEFKLNHDFQARLGGSPGLLMCHCWLPEHPAGVRERLQQPVVGG